MANENKTSGSEPAVAGSLERLVSRRRSKCNCALCKRGRRYYRNTANLCKAEREWMRGFYDAVLNQECEQSMEAANKD